MAVGPVRMSVAVGAGIEWNDNVFLSDDNRESANMVPITGQGSAQTTRSALSVVGAPPDLTMTSTPVSVWRTAVTGVP